MELLTVKILTCSGAAQKSNHPPVCSINTLINLSIEPSSAQCIITGVSKPPSILVYFKLNL